MYSIRYFITFVMTPIISFFYGIKISVYSNDHLPPHCHCEYAEYTLMLNLVTLEIIDGWLPTKSTLEIMNIKYAENYSPRILPHVLRINEVIESQLMVSVLFSNGENRWLDFNDIFNNVWNSTPKDFEYPLKDPKEFKKVILEDGTLVWHNIKVPWTNLKGDKEFDPFATGPDTLYELSYPDDSRNINIGEMLRLWRTSAELTQAEVARRSGTSRSYITKIEAGRQDIELGTLSRIVQATFGKSLNITLK